MLQDLVFQDAELEFTEQTQHASDSLVELLQTDPRRPNWINLKLLRDLICQQETSRGDVFVWGVSDERCCSEN
jgi:hypothetical protein